MGMGGGGGGSTTSTPNYTPEQQQMQRDLINYIRMASDQGGGGGGFFASPQNAYNAFAPTDFQRQIASQTIGSMGNQFTGPVSGMNPWMQMMESTIANNPAVQGGPQANMPSAISWGLSGVNPQNMQGMNEAFNSDAMIKAAQNNLNTIMAPQLAQQSIASGSNPLSGAYAEAMAQAGTQMALPITQQISQQQYGAAMPQIQAMMASQLQHQAAQQDLQRMGYGNYLQGLLQQGQNQFAYGMGLPGQQAQMLNNIYGLGQNQMGLAGLDQQARANAFLNAQNQWAQQLSALSQTPFTNPGMSQTSSPGGGGFNMGGSAMGALGGAATGAMIGSAIPVIGTGLGALGGGLFGAFGGGFCWIADALYGEGSEEAEAARAWVTHGWQGEEADAFREWYEQNGQEVAEFLKNNEQFRIMHEDTYRQVFDEFVVLGRGLLAHAV